jgi:hypothetical protein
MRIKASLLNGLLIALALVLIPVTAVSAQKITSGSTCKALNQKVVFQNKTYTCIKSGKKLVWNKGVAVAKPTPTPTPTTAPSATPTPTPTPTPRVVNLTFDNLYENRADISYSVWKKSSDLIKESSSKAGNISIFTGPNTKTFFDDYPFAVSQVSKLFPSKSEAKEVLVIRYVFKDLEWAENMAKTKLSSIDYNQILRWENGPITKSNCDSTTQNCRGSKQITPSSGIAVILQGVEEQITQSKNGTIRFTTGMLEAHEYFHSLQRIPIMDRGVEVWPHAWWREGSAEWVQNMSISFQNFPQYQQFLEDDCYNSCKNLTALQIEEFLNTAYDNYLPAKFDSWLNYSLGSHVVEILVAIKGPDALIAMYEEMGKGLKFDDSFYKIFGLGWKESIPIVAKTIHANLQG